MAAENLREQIVRYIADHPDESFFGVAQAVNLALLPVGDELVKMVRDALALNRANEQAAKAPSGDGLVLFGSLVAILGAALCSQAIDRGRAK